MPTFHPPPPNGISYNLSPTASPSKVSSGVHPAESFVTGRPLQREPPQQSVDVKSVMRPLFSPKMLERATNHAPASQWAASAGGSGGNGEGAEGQMKQFREVQASAEAKSSSWEAERQQLEAVRAHPSSIPLMPHIVRLFPASPHDLYPGFPLVESPQRAAAGLGWRPVAPACDHRPAGPD